MDAMTKGQRNLLLFLLGVVILFVPIRFVALSNFDDRKELVSKKDEQYDSCICILYVSRR